MNSILKRIIAIALLISLTAFCASAEFIAEDIDVLNADELGDESDICEPFAGCTHSEYELIGDPSAVTPSILRYDAVYHKSAKVMTAICLKKSCAKKITVYVNTQYIPHTFTDNGDDHRDGTSVHRYFQICNACGEETYFDMYCLDCE